MRNQRTPTAIEVIPLDLTELAKKAFEATDKAKFPKATRCIPHYKYGFVETKQGLYAFDDDGVGNKDLITADNHFEIYFLPEYDGGGYLFSSVGYGLDDEDLRRLASKERVNLADFIRTFGARLERNYEVWRKVLEKANKARVA